MPALKRTASNAGDARPLKRTKSSRAVPVSLLRPIASSTTSVPQKMVVKSCYVREFTLNPGVNTPSTATFKANDLFVPEQAVPATSGPVGPHQPISFDQFDKLYLNFKVLSSKITVVATAENSTATQAPMYIALQKHENASYAPNSITQILERGLSKMKVLGTADGGNSSCILKDTYRLSRDQPNRLMTQGQLGSGGASPDAESQYFFSIAACPTDSANDPAIARILVRIDYTVEWSSPLQTNLS